jgi:hypothetical protein
MLDVGQCPWYDIVFPPNLSDCKTIGRRRTDYKEDTVVRRSSIVELGRGVESRESRERRIDDDND